MKIKYINILCAAYALAQIAITPAIAQVDKAVEVTQAFIPTVKEAVKPTLTPDMSDDAVITPDIDYSITPISIHTPLETTLYKPVEMDYWEYKSQHHYYAKLGAGLPFRSVADLYGSRVDRDRGYLIGFLNHDGEYADITNDYGMELDALNYQLRTGIAAGLLLGTKTLEGTVSYENDKWSRYATDASSDQHPLYQRLALTGQYGDSFTDMSRFNFGIGANIEQMWSRSEHSNTSLGMSFDTGGTLFGGEVKGRLSYNNIWGSNEYSNSTFGVGLNYYSEGEIANILVGVKYYNDGVSYIGVDGERENIVIPQLLFNYRINSTKVVGYINIDGELRSNSYGELSRINPYVMAGLFGDRSSVDYNLNIGIKGALCEDKLGYRIYAGYKAIKNSIYWAYYQIGSGDSSIENGYVAAYSTRHDLGGGVQLHYAPSSKLSLQFASSVTNYNDGDMEWENSQAKTEISLGGRYRIGGFSFGVSGEMLSRRIFSQIAYDETGVGTLATIEIPTTFNLGAELEYKFSNSDTVIFCDLDNICNSNNIYDWARYRKYGISAILGVKFEF